jgi:hypothetical protein
LLSERIVNASVSITRFPLVHSGSLVIIYKI